MADDGIKWDCPYCGGEIDDYDADGIGWCMTKCGFVTRTKEIFNTWLASLPGERRPLNVRNG